MDGNRLRDWPFPVTSEGLHRKLDLCNIVCFMVYGLWLSYLSPFGLGGEEDLMNE